MSIVLDWNGSDLPEELRELPAGRYVVERLDDAPLLSDDEERGLLLALESIAQGRGVPADAARDRLEGRLRR